MLKVECKCNECRSSIEQWHETFCFWCVDKLHDDLAKALSRVAELEERLKDFA